VPTTYGKLRTYSALGSPAWATAEASHDGKFPAAGDIVGMLAYVKRTTVKLPDDLDARLRHEAERRRSTVSELTREAIEAHLGGNWGRRKLIAAAAGRSGSHDVSARIEEILRNEVSR
jgi:predicted transcriptional regulator